MSRFGISAEGLTLRGSLLRRFPVFECSGQRLKQVPCRGWFEVRFSQVRSAPFGLLRASRRKPRARVGSASRRRELALLRTIAGVRRCWA